MKKSQKSLRDWTNQKWRTSDGSPSKGKKRYLPDAAWKALSPGEKAATNRTKAAGNKKGKQFVKQPKNIAKKTAKYRAMGGLISSKFQNGGQLPKYETTLSQKEEANFMPWLESQYKAGNITKGDFDFYKKNNYGYNYDFRAAYKEGLKSSLNSKDNMQHWGDIGKKPNHPTFSNESKYHNVDGNIGGSWDGENFIPAYVAPDLLEVEITPEGTEIKDQPRELEAYYRDYAAQYPVTDKKDITKQYKERARNYAAEQLLKANPQGDRDRKDWLNSFTSQELAVLRNSDSKGKVNPTLMQKFAGALKQGAAAGAPGDLRYKKVETESLTDEEMKDVGGLDLLGPLAIPAKLVQAGYKDGYSFLDALKGQENDASLIEDIATDPLNLVGIGLVSKGASAAKLLKAYKNLSKLSNAKRASTLQNAYKASAVPGFQFTKDISSALKGTSNFILDEIKGELKQGKLNRKSIAEGNEWLQKWINDPITQKKITDSLRKEKKPDEIIELLTPRLELIEKQSKTFTPNTKEYSLLKQFKDNLKQYDEILGSTKDARDPIHEGNAGVSYMHNFSPEQREYISEFPSAAPDRAGSYVSRSPKISQEQRVSITIHEGAHDWVSKSALESSGMRELFLKNTNPKLREDFLKWEKLKNEGKNADEIMGEDKAYWFYLADPTEQYSRIMELRKVLNLTPENNNFITPEYAEEVIKFIDEGGSSVEPAFLEVFDRDPKKLAELFKKSWAVAPVAAAGTAMSQEKAMGGTLDKSVMGYRDDSPYKNEPYIDINTPTGEIDMSKTGVSLYANGKLLKPYSGKHKFNTSKVREVPVSNSWLDKYK